MNQRSGPATRPPLILQVTVAADAETVFRTFFQEPQRWLCRTGMVEPRPDGRLRLCWPDGCVEGRLVQFEPPHKARFSWHLEGDPLPETMVVVGLQPAERGGQPVTAVEVEHYGFGAGDEWEPLFVGAVRAWAGYLKNLRSVLETGTDLREPDE